MIDQALGIIRSRSGCSSDEAVERLRAMSQTKNTKLTVVAKTLVDEAVRRAIARHTGQ
jgi:AmiR/NasT family two-component response regulator